MKNTLPLSEKSLHIKYEQKKCPQCGRFCKTYWEEEDETTKSLYETAGEFSQCCDSKIRDIPIEDFITFLRKRSRLFLSG